MEYVSRKLEVMLSKLQKMNINMLNLWFPHLDKEEILKVLRESNKFKFEGEYVRIKTYEEIYEEELKRKIEDIENGDFNENKKVVKKESEEKVEEIEKEIEEPIVNKNETIKKDSKAKKINFANNIIIEEQPLDINSINGAELEYDDILRIIKEYNENVEFRLEKFDGNSFDAKLKSILEFYGNKYNLEEEKVEDKDLGISMYSLTNKKKNLEAGYVVISPVLDEKIVEYMSDNYSDEVIYFCPINGTTKEFEFDLNEFFIKDTSKIFKKFLKKCVVSEEKDIKIKKVDIITGI
ncbi:hypothetical protein HMPREF1092_02320 [Clostridium thermobutyricum]|uniref:Uncharacterized protein n=1 Tax=Clostridium thermobutyricum TaxID=29372 RepID=N9XLW4_9CLOT|nr:hypothetical protein [Clostridium thermobutyricum]ENZ00668.1 hypothetical protein HMPREF1092_02320 [Clostridium thermobutyricum]